MELKEIQRKVDMKKRDIIFGALLCFVGGAIDGYSYVMRGGVLATAQTGNLLLLGIHISNGNWTRALSYVLPILCFMLGTCLAKLAYEKICRNDMRKWQEGIMLTEVAVFVILGFIGARVPNLLANATISFFSSMQYCAFRNFGEDAPFSTVFSTGNMRSFVDNIYEGTVHKNRTAIKRSVGYAIMIIVFALGALSSNLFSMVLGYQSCWLVSAILLIACVFRRIKR